MKLFLLLSLILSSAARAEAPIIWHGSLAKLLATRGLEQNNGAQIIVLTSDPSTSLGYHAPPGSIGQRNNSSVGEFWLKSGNNDTSWILMPQSSGGSGTVTSVAFSAPSIFSVGGSPITTSGTISLTSNTQPANLVYAGDPTSGSTIPTFRSLVGNDLPFPQSSSLGGAMSSSSVASQWLNGLGTNGVFTASQPSFTDILGIATGAQLPNPSSTTLGGAKSSASVASQWINGLSTTGSFTTSRPSYSDITGSLPNPSATTLGGIESIAAAAHKWINSISTSGVPTQTQPDFTDITGFVAQTQMPQPLGSSLGGVIASASVANQFLNGLGTNGVFTASRPSFANISGTASSVPAVQSDAINTMLPSQSGSVGKFLKTDGATLSWATASGSSTTPVYGASIECLSGGSVIDSQTGTWVSSVGTRSTNHCAITVAGGIFATAPQCVISANTSAPFATGVIDNSTTTVTAYQVSSGDFGFVILCRDGTL